MRGEKYAYAFALKRKKDIQQIVARYGIESACGFIEYKQLRPVAQRKRERIFHLHAGGKLIRRFVFIQLKLRHIAAVRLLVPSIVKAARNAGYGLDFLFYIVIYAAGNEAYLFFYLQLVLFKFHAEKAYLSAAWMHQIEY